MEKRRHLNYHVRGKVDIIAIMSTKVEMETEDPFIDMAQDEWIANKSNLYFRNKKNTKSSK